MHLTRVSHVLQDPVLQLGHWVECIRRILVLLDFADDFSRLRSLREVNELAVLDDGCDAVFDEH